MSVKSRPNSEPSSRKLAEPLSLPSLAIPTRASIRRSPIETHRLVLLPIELVDAADFWEAVDGSRWHLERWLPWVPYNNSPEASVRFAEACMAEWDAGRSLRFGIRDRSTRQFLGVVGLDTCVHIHKSCDLGYWLRREATGKGVMTEAAAACIEFAFRRVGLHRIRCAAATDNTASLRVISRLNFRFEGIARQSEFVGSRWLDHALFARLTSDS